MPVRLITAPALEPVTLREAKDHLRLEHDLDDLRVLSCMRAARMYAEKICWRGFLKQTYQLVESGFPDDDGLPFEQQGVELPRGNLVSITSVTYVDTAGATQTMAPADYVADQNVEPGRLRIAYGKVWPSTRDQFDAVKVTYLVGWDAVEVPEPVKQALLLLVAQMYENRTPEVTGPIVSQLSFAVDALLGPFRLSRLP